ncbi:hypothetical protein CLAFUW4_09115 [Fulvia fulva]|nr:hypothetical protein CLAFUR4_09121 [Fulvia fulva]KAK4614341.1 hypothetical protein CLAFUR0_09113 [Fulvia fulva]WPV19793.1 hypothetical protein CLAFUW4_09115 [Fulvia fulva]WPV34767.1 hypothetical protein CLAFUW7_09116 [Fulvia fulva]
MPHRAMDEQRRALAEEGLKYSAVAPLVEAIWSKYGYGTKGWDPDGCVKHFKTVLELMQKNTIFATVVASGDHVAEIVKNPEDYSQALIDLAKELSDPDMGQDDAKDVEDD